MAKSARSFLTDELKRRLLPRLAAEGWQVVKRPPEFDSPELSRSAPLGPLRRPRSGGIQALDLQFDKRYGPRFRVSLGTLPAAGLASAIGGPPIPPAALDALNAPDAVILRAWLLGDWFGFWPWQTPSRDRAARVVDRCLAHWGEVESFFRDGSVGPHLRPAPP
jgi:hypothetical protein